jgi:hypothetical protein
MRLLLLKKIPLLLLGFLFSTLAVQAQGLSGEQLKIRVQFKNESKKDVWVLISYLPYTGGNKISDEQARNSFMTNGWFKVSKGQTAYLFDTWNRIFYFYATTSTDFFGNWREWKGGYWYNFQGKNYGFRMITIGESEMKYDGDHLVADYTLRLTK